MINSATPPAKKKQIIASLESMARGGGGNPGKELKLCYVTVSSAHALKEMKFTELTHTYASRND